MPSSSEVRYAKPSCPNSLCRASSSATVTRSIRQVELFLKFLCLGLAFSSFFWVLYIAMEPYVRRRPPATLVSWSRLLVRGFRDPLVGRDVLAGCLWGALVADLSRCPGISSHSERGVRYSSSGQTVRGE